MGEIDELYEKYDFYTACYLTYQGQERKTYTFKVEKSRNKLVNIDVGSICEAFYQVEGNVIPILSFIKIRKKIVTKDKFRRDYRQSLNSDIPILTIIKPETEFDIDEYNLVKKEWKSLLKLNNASSKRDLINDKPFPDKFTLYSQIHILSQNGYSRKSIAENLGIHRNTVSRYLKIKSYSELELLDSKRRKTKLSAFRDYILDLQLKSPQITGSEIYHRLQKMGYDGSKRSVLNFLKENRN